MAKYQKDYRWKKHDTVIRTAMAEVGTLVLNNNSNIQLCDLGRRT